MRSKKVLGWHFTEGMRLRDGQPLIVGKLYKHDGELKMCKSGYHASVDIRDALRYAPGFTVSRVECSGEIINDTDKMVCERRKALWSFDAKKVILEWSIRVATDAVKTVKKVYTDKTWNAWADLWIGGEDRTEYAAAYAANAAANAAANDAYAANAAAYAAYAANAANAAYAAAYAANAARDAANAANAARDAANASARAARACFSAREKYSGWLVTMIEEAMNGKRKGGKDAK
jgi:hypothetical protein